MKTTIPPNEQRNTRMSPLGYPTNLLAPGQTYETVNETIGSIVLRNRQPATWWIGFVIAFGLLMMFFFALAWLFIRGVGIWGINIPVAWGFDRKFRLVGRDRSCRNIHLRHPSSYVSTLAHRN